MTQRSNMNLKIETDNGILVQANQAGVSIGSLQMITLDPRDFARLARAIGGIVGDWNVAGTVRTANVPGTNLRVKYEVDTDHVEIWTNIHGTQENIAVCAMTATDWHDIMICCLQVCHDITNH